MSKRMGLLATLAFAVVLVSNNDLSASRSMTCHPARTSSPASFIRR